MGINPSREVRQEAGRSVGAGEGLCGEGTLASPWQGEKHAQERNEGDASVPSHHIRHPRPYGYEGASEAMSQNTYLCKGLPPPW